LADLDEISSMHSAVNLAQYLHHISHHKAAFSLRASTRVDARSEKAPLDVRHYLA